MRPPPQRTPLQPPRALAGVPPPLAARVWGKVAGNVACGVRVLLCGVRDRDLAEWRGRSWATGHWAFLLGHR